MEIGVTALPHFPKDATDRNRTSPLAFTGNKFEFRMPGSALSIADPNIVLNTIVADALQQFADMLEKSDNFNDALSSLIRNNYREHKRIIFNGNNYSQDWIAQAKTRGLSNLKTAVDSFGEFISEKSIGLFARHRVYSESELHSRYEILMENYSKTIHIEALTMVDMVKTLIIPACIDYENDVSALLERKKALGKYNSFLEDHLLGKISLLSENLLKKLHALEDILLKAKAGQDNLDHAVFFKDTVLSAMSALRFIVDELETITARKHWPLPSYAELLYSIV